MRARTALSKSGGGRAWTVAVIVALQSLAAAFFVVDAIADLQRDGLSAHIAIEGSVALALLAGIAFGARQLRTMLADARRRDAALAAASGALTDVIHARFAAWGLTLAEADVALFALKGCDAAEIARLRNTAAGTVRAQLARAYAKAGVGSRAALVSLFIEDLLDGAPAMPAAAAA
jgi:DNA-binding CsgD family transcriptional regulator